MTKRHLESLPQTEQDAIPGRPTDDEEEENLTGRMALACLPTLLAGREERKRAGLNPDGPGAILGGIDNAYISLDEWTNDAENEPTDEELNDPLVKCRICRESRPISQMNTNGECPACQRETALMVKPEGKCVTLEDSNGVAWKL